MDKIYETDELLDSGLSEYEARETQKIMREVMTSYLAEKDKSSVEEWLPKELGRQLPERSQKQIQLMSDEIISSLKVTEEKKASLQKAVDSGRSKESWLASSLMESTSLMSTQESARYLQQLDDVVCQANEQMAATIRTQAGLPNRNPNLDGFIAEQHHVNSYNMNAQAKGSNLHAEVLKPAPGETYSRNSVDIVIKDSGGKIVSRYQAKYGATAEDTIRMVREGNYRGQQLLVPQEQVESVQKAFPDRKVSSTIGDAKLGSTPLSKEEAKSLQEKAQSGDLLSQNWNGYSNKDLALQIGQHVGYATLQGAAIGAGMNVVSKVCSGEPVDGGEVLESALVSGADFGVKAATAAALKTASEKGVLSVIPKGTNENTFANIAFVAVENVKVLGKVASGELTVQEGIDTMQQTTAASVAGLTAASIGKETGKVIGATLGLTFGPAGAAVGAVVGGFVGGTIGYMAGSKVGETVVKGAQKVRDAAKSVVRSAGSAIKSGVSSVFSSIGRVFGW